MIKECSKCSERFNSDGELICTMCRVASYDFSTAKRDHTKNIKSWNEYAKKSNDAVIAKHAPKGNIKYLERVVDSNLNIHSSSF